MSEFTMPSTITTASRLWIDSTVKAEETAKVRDAKFLASLVTGYTDDLSPKFKANLSSAVTTYIGGRKATSAQQSRASKFVAEAWITVGLKSVGVERDSLGTVKVGDVQRDAVRMVINGEGGKPFASFRKAFMTAAKEGRWSDLTGIVASAAPVTEAEAAASETSEDTADESLAAESSPNVSAAVDATNLVRTLRTLAAMVSESLISYDEVQMSALGDAVTLLESAIGSKVAAATAPAAV